MPFPPRRASALRARRPLIATLALAGTALAAAALAGPAQAATTPQYKLTLSPVAGSQYLAINNNGDITGSAPQRGSGFPAAFLLKAGSSTPLFLNPPASDGFATAEGLNDSDQVVGESDTGLFTALEWPDSSTPTDLSQLPTLAKSFFKHAGQLDQRQRPDRRLRPDPRQQWRPHQVLHDPEQHG